MHPEPKAHPDYFKKEIVQLAGNACQVSGHAASKVDTNDGVVVGDKTETTAAAENVLAEFRKITDKLVNTIILPHSHLDQVSGASVIAKGGCPDILASDKPSGNSLIGAGPHPRATKAMRARTKRQFGIGPS